MRACKTTRGDSPPDRPAAWGSCRWLPLCAALLLFSSPAAAESDPGAEVERLRAEGKDCYRLQDYRCALSKFQAAFALQPSPAMRFNIASARDKLGQYALAVRQYQEYLRQAGTNAPPRATAHIQRRLKLLFQRVARLRLAVDPPAAVVSIDGETFDLVGCAPGGAPAGCCEIVLEPGTHQLAAVAPGYEPLWRQLPASAGQSESLTLQLVRLPGAETGSLSLSSTPSGAWVWIDGEPFKVATPVEIKELAPGEHTLRLTTPTRRFEGVVHIEAGRRSEVSAVLQPVQVELALTSEPPGARAVLDGQPVGTTPALIKEVAAGRHHLRLVRSGHLPLEQVLEIDGGSPARVLAHTVLERRPEPPAPPPRPMARPLMGALFSPETGILDNAATFFFDLAQADSTALTLGLEGRLSWADRLQLALAVPLLTRGLFPAGDNDEVQTAFGDLRLLLKIKLLGDSQGAVVVSGFAGGTLPTSSLELPSRSYSSLKGGVAVTGRLAGFTLGGDLATFAELNEGQDWLLLSASAFGALHLTGWLELQLGVQVAPSLTPRLDAPAVGVFPAVTVSWNSALALGLGARIAATETGRYLLCRGASRVLLLLNVAYSF